MSILKSEEDIQTIFHSGKILASMMHHLKPRVKPGVSAGDLNDFAEEFILDHGGRPSFKGLYGYPYTLITELNEEVVHGMSPKEKVIPEKAIVSFDCGVEYKGLYTDMCILMTFGELLPEEKLLVEKTEESLYAGINQVKAGKRVGDIGYAVDNLLKKAGLGNVLDLGGHGLGYKPHDDPHIMHAGRPGKGARLFENQVIAIEPMVTLGSGEVEFVEVPGSDLEVVVSKERVMSAHIEHTVLVTKKGYEIVTAIDPKDVLT